MTWTTRRVPAHTTAGGGGLAFAGDGRRLHVAVSGLEGAVVRYVEGEQIADDGSAYMWTQDSGRTWSRKLVLKGYGPSVAAAGDHVYLAFLAYACPSVGVLHNADRGAPRSWSGLVCLGLDASRAEIAASGRGVYVATDDRGGIAAWTSRDRGRTYRRTWLARPSDEWTYPVGVAAEGPHVMIAAGGESGGLWTSDDAGATWKRAKGIPDGKVTAVAAGQGLQAIAGAVMEAGTDGETEPGAAWVAIRPAGGTWTLLPAMPGPGERPSVVSALGVAADGSVDVVVTAWDGDCSVGGWTSWSEGVGWTGYQSIADCPDEPVLAESRDGTPVVLTYGNNDKYEIAVGSPRPDR